MDFLVSVPTAQASSRHLAVTTSDADLTLCPWKSQGRGVIFLHLLGEPAAKVSCVTLVMIPCQTEECVPRVSFPGLEPVPSSPLGTVSTA